MIKGIDVSSIQGVINWDVVAKTGIQFGIAKCFQGNDDLDPQFKNNIAGMKAAGIYSACYQFIYPLQTDPTHPSRDPISQAQLHFNACQGEISCIDCEWPVQSDWVKWGINASFINDWILSYLQEYEKLSGNKPLIYTYPDWAKSVKFSQDFAQYKLWIASYEPTPTIPSPWNSWDIWQNTGGGGKLPSGAPVDTDVVRDLTLWGVSQPVPLVSIPNVSSTPIVAQQTASTPSVEPAPVTQSTTVAPIISPTNTIVPVKTNNMLDAIVNFLLDLLKSITKK